MSGFAGTDCSLKVFGTATERKRKKNKESGQKKTTLAPEACKDVNCGDGTCYLEHGRPSCRCTGGFIAQDCSHDSRVLSIAQGSVTFAPTDQLRTELALNYSPLFSREFCNGSQSISIDFRTKKSSGVVVALSYEAEFAVIEHVGLFFELQLHASMLRYRVFDSYRTPIEITLDGQSVDDGNWHQVVLELSEDRKVNGSRHVLIRSKILKLVRVAFVIVRVVLQITFKLDGTGKQAVSRIVLPSILSPDLKRMQLGINGLRGDRPHTRKLFWKTRPHSSIFRQFSGCLRRFIINGYLQPMNAENTSSEYFTRTVSGDVSTSCHLGSAHLAVFQKPGVLASILCVGVLVAAILAVFTVARVIRRRQEAKESSWEHAQEIDAYAMRKPRTVPHLGHVNHAMTSSVEGPIYASADGYETPIAHIYRDQRPQISHRIVGDVVLGVKSLSSAAVDYNEHSPRSPDLDQQPPRPPQRMYRNVAYF
ncbi:hypothetical protein OESDEN_13630 [Oesophagostomum dentatum]|uniref:Laminin G domain-containing protein n=1 Tax=Oesophagostomum dentatum TaxID=61180 RepID=A0A0B1STV2_OESDE|nr:hypothetical protein OESDEN_13630 [Oesophagostomum dentatum]